MPAGIGGPQQQRRAALGVDREPRGALERGGCRRVRTAVEASGAGLLERCRSRLIGPDGGGRQVPGPAVDVAVGQRAGERAVRRASLLRRRAGVDRRPGERMAELDRACSQRDQPGALGRGQCRQIDPERRRGPRQHRQIAAVAGRRQRQGVAGLARRAARPRRRNAPEMLSEISSGAPEGASTRSSTSDASSSNASGLPAVASCSCCARGRGQAGQQCGRVVTRQTP